MSRGLEENPVFGHWSGPVYVRIGHGSSETIDNAGSALRFLTLRWPTERGEKYNLACIVCANALERRASPEEAKEAFIAAAIEAYVLA